jgi:hypothetical protein
MQRVRQKNGLADLREEYCDKIKTGLSKLLESR